MDPNPEQTLAELHEEVLADIETRIELVEPLRQLAENAQRDRLLFLIASTVESCLELEAQLSFITLWRGSLHRKSDVHVKLAKASISSVAVRVDRLDLVASRNEGQGAMRAFLARSDGRLRRAKQLRSDVQILLSAGALPMLNAESLIQGARAFQRDFSALSTGLMVDNYAKVAKLSSELNSWVAKATSLTRLVGASDSLRRLGELALSIADEARNV